MASDLYALLVHYMLNGCIHQVEYYTNSYESAMACVKRYKNAQSRCMNVLYVTIHKTYFDDQGILVPEYESVYVWEKNKSDEDNN